MTTAAKATASGGFEPPELLADAGHVLDRDSQRLAVIESEPYVPSRHCASIADRRSRSSPNGLVRCGPWRAHRGAGASADVSGDSDLPVNPHDAWDQVEGVAQTRARALGVDLTPDRDHAASDCDLE